MLKVDLQRTGWSMVTESPVRRQGFSFVRQTDPHKQMRISAAIRDFVLQPNEQSGKAQFSVSGWVYNGWLESSGYTVGGSRDKPHE